MRSATAITSPVNIKKRVELGIRSGDTVRVWQKIEEKGKTRLQAFEGLVLARKHGNEAGGTFTVRRVSGSIGVEKIFSLYSPMIDKIEIVKRSKVRRAKLYYIREKVAREIRRQMRKTMAMDLSTGSDSEEKTRLAEGESPEESKQEGDTEEATKGIQADAEQDTQVEVDEETPQEGKKE